MSSVLVSTVSIFGTFKSSSQASAPPNYPANNGSIMQKFLADHQCCSATTRNNSQKFLTLPSYRDHGCCWTRSPMTTLVPPVSEISQEVMPICSWLMAIYQECETLVREAAQSSRKHQPTPQIQRALTLLPQATHSLSAWDSASYHVQQQLP